jgi:minor tail protein/transglycosylase-like protein with SLT domain
MAQSTVVGRGLVEILPDFRKWGKQLAADMKTANRQLDGSAAGLRRSAATVGASMARIGKGASLVGVGVAVAATKMAGDFQAETAVLQTAAGETTKGLATVRKGILSISENTGTGIKNLTDGMYTIEKAGFRGANGLKILKAAAQGAREENANLADVTNAMTSIMASYHMKAGSAVMVMNAMKTAAGEGKINMEEFSGALSTVLPIASANKISFAQVAGAMATLTQHGTSAREATHELGATIRALASPNMVAQREMARFGLSSVDVSQNLGKRGLTGTIELLTGTILKRMGPSGKILLSAFEGTKQSAEDARIMISKMPPEFQKLSKQFLSGKIDADQWKATIKGAPVAVQPMLRNFQTLVNRSKGFSRELKSGGPAAKTYTDSLKKMSGGAIGLNTILQLSGESFDGFKERVKKVDTSIHHNTKNVEGWKTTQKLLNVQLDMMKQRIQVLLINIGTKLIPVVVRIVKLFTEHKTITLVLVSALLGMVGILSAAYVAMKAWAVITGIIKAAQIGWTIATMAQTESLTVMRAQLALLWLQEKAAALWTGIVTAAQWAWNVAMDANPIALIVLAIAALVAAIVYVATKTQFFQKLWKTVWGGIQKIVQGFVHWLKDNWQLVIFTILTGGIGLAVAMIVRHWKGVKHAFSESIDWIKHNWPLLLAILTGPIGLAVLYIVRHWKGISDGASKAFHAVIDFAVRMGKDIGTFFSKLPGQLGHFFSTLPGIVGHWFVVAGKAIGDFFTKLPGRIMSYTNKFNVLLISVGTDLIKGFFHGAETFFTKTVPNWAKNIWHGIVSFFKAVFGIHSPSTVMAALGVDLIKGLFEGMLKISVKLVGFLSDHIGKPIINLFTKSIPTAAHYFQGMVSGYWGAVKDNVGKAFSGMKHAAIDPLINLFNAKIPGAGRSMRDLIIGFVRTMVLHVLDGFGNIIHGASKLFGWVPGVGGKLKSASRAFDNFRDDVNRALGGIKDRHPTVGVGMKIMTGKDAGLVNIGGIARAKGGPIDGPGTETSDDVPAWLSKNEHVWTAKEVKAVGGHGAMMRLRMLALMGLLKGFNKGGEVKGYASGGAVDVKANKPSAGAINSGVSKGFGNFFRENVGALIKAFKAQYAAVTNVGPAGAGVKRWTGMVQSVLGQLHESLGWTATVLRRMNQESGGNPNIVNKWDSNWKAGHPSVGLMQVIAGTFRAYAGRYRGVGPFMYGVSVNPTANTYAGLNYAIHRYGSLSALNRPGGYDSGGIARGIGALLKGTTGPERVLSPRQTAAFERLVNHLPAGGAGGGAVIKELHLHNHGVIGSKHEVENWLVDSIDQLHRKGRI